MKLMFDCDDTLYDLQEPFYSVVQKMLPNLDMDMEEFYATYRFHGDEVFVFLEHHLIDIFTSGVYRIYMACKQYNIPFTFDQCMEFQKEYAANQKKISMDPTLKKYIETTQAEIAVLSNGQHEHQMNKFITLELPKYFKDDHLMTSGQLGVSKPDPNIFLSACSRLHTKPDEWFYIGDNYINDMEGAKAVGMKTIHINRHHQKSGPCADYVVYDDQQLVELLIQLEKEMV